MQNAERRKLRGAGVRLARVAKRFGEITAVHALDLEIEPAELVVVVGPSGCGKTTVLRIIAGLEDPTEGSVLLDSHDVTGVEPADQDIAMVFQNYALYPHMTVAQNLAFALRMRRMPKAEIAGRVERAAAVLGIQHLLDRRPGQLSGGQRQRVALGRATVREPRVFLFDEPLSNLDAKLRAEMRQEIAELHRRLSATMIFVTHDQVEAMTLGDRIAVLHDGRLQQYASPLKVYREPANLFVAQFIGTPGINTIAGVVGPPGPAGAAAGRRDGAEQRAEFWAGDIRLSLGREIAGKSTVLAVRPEDITLSDAGGTGADFAADVDRLEPLGNEILVHVRRDPELRWVVRARADWSGRAGDRVGLRLDRARLHLFDQATGVRL